MIAESFLRFHLISHMKEKIVFRDIRVILTKSKYDIWLHKPTLE